MATTRGLTSDHLIEQLQAQPRRFAFFEALHRLERHVARSGGTVSPRLDEVLQVRPDTSLACPSSDIHAFELLPPIDVDDERDRYRMTVSFLGLYGVDSPLPDYYLEEFAQDDDEESPKRRFIDVFHHRLYGLLFECWKKYRYYVQYRADGSDLFSRRMFALSSLGTTTIRENLGFAPQRLLPFLGLLSRRESSAAMLETIINAVAGVDARIEPFILSKVTIASSQRARLGRANSCVGRNLTLGVQVPTRGSRFRIHLHDLTGAQFESLLPGGWRRRLIDGALRQTMKRPLDYDFELRVRKKQTPALVLGASSAVALGRTSWLLGEGSVAQAVRFEGEQVC